MSENNGKEVPAGWAMASLGEVTNSAVAQSGPGGETPFTYIDISSVDNAAKRIVSPKLLAVTAAPSRAKQRLAAGDVVVSMTRPNLNAVAFIPAEHDGAIGSTGFHVLRASHVEPSWLFYAVQRPGFVRAMCQLVQGALYPAVRPKDIRCYELPIPPAAEQRRIVERLDELFSDLNAGVAALELARAKLGQYRTTLLKAAVEGELTAEWREKHPATEPASELLERILAERRLRWEEVQLQRFKDAGKAPPKDWKAKYQKPVDPDTTNLPNLPEGWCWANLDSLFVDGPQNGVYYPGDRYGSGTQILRIDDYQNGWVRDAAQLRQVSAEKDDVELYSLREGDLVINRVNSMTHLGKCLVVSKTLEGCLFESNMMRSRFASLVRPHYIEVYLHSIVGRQRLIKGAKWAVNQASINQQDVKRTAVPLAPLLEQIAVVETIEDQLSVIEHLEADLEAKLKNSQALHQSILRHAFTGQLVQQNPSDEPASELLKRIAAEREERDRQNQAAKQAKTKSKTPRKRTAKSRK
jgi:type I restriction enzyme, S subunit